jgi:hypothetical protein
LPSKLIPKIFKKTNRIYFRENDVVISVIFEFLTENFVVKLISTKKRQKQTKNGFDIGFHHHWDDLSQMRKVDQGWCD